MHVYAYLFITFSSALGGGAGSGGGWGGVASASVRVTMSGVAACKAPTLGKKEVLSLGVYFTADNHKHVVDCFYIVLS